jgi:hypothetical protein
VKEGLVAAPRDWPGVTGLPALLGGTLEGIWYQRNVEYRARLRGVAAADAHSSIRYSITLTPLPCWQHLSAQERIACVEGLVRDIEAGIALAASAGGSEPRGPKFVLGQHPHTRPPALAKSDAPRCHSSLASLRLGFLTVYRRIVAAFEDAATALRDGTLDVAFPAGTFPARRPFVEGEPLEAMIGLTPAPG